MTADMNLITGFKARMSRHIEQFEHGILVELNGAALRLWGMAYTDTFTTLDKVGQMDWLMKHGHRISALNSALSTALKEGRA